MPPNPCAVQIMIKCPKTEFNTWLKGFAPGFSAWFSYEEVLREHTLDFFQHCLSEYSCVQTETRGQQPKKASLPQQTLPGGVILFASVSGAVTSSLLTLEAMLMAEGLCAPAGPFPHPTVGYTGCCVKTVLWEEGRPRNVQQEIVSLKTPHI